MSELQKVGSQEHFWAFPGLAMGLGTGLDTPCPNQAVPGSQVEARSGVSSQEGQQCEAATHR